MRRLIGQSFLAFLAGALTGCSGGGNAGPPDAGGVPDGAFQWSLRAPLPVSRTELRVAAVAGKIYAMGGSSGSTLARVDAYDPATDSWTQKAPMHTARRDFAHGVINGKIYVGPGMSWVDPNAVTYVASTEVYDPATDIWTDLAPCPIPSAPNAVWGNLFFGGGAANGRFYVVAVRTGSSSVYEYDPGSNAWSVKATGPTAFSQVTAAPLGGVLYTFASPAELIAGGLASYDPVADSWVTGPGLPSYSRSAFVAAGGKLYALGGVTGSVSSCASTAAVHEYDPASGAWTSRGALTHPREDAGAVELGGHVFVIGGDVLAPGTGRSGTPSAVVEEGVPR